jgi:hypothetical protein
MFIMSGASTDSSGPGLRMESASEGGGPGFAADSKLPGRGVAEGFGMGPGGHCLCPVCRLCVPHQAGKPCQKTQCPKCGKPMIRNG